MIGYWVSTFPAMLSFLVSSQWAWWVIGGVKLRLWLCWGLVSVSATWQKTSWPLLGRILARASLMILCWSCTILSRLSFSSSTLALPSVKHNNLASRSAIFSLDWSSFLSSCQYFSFSFWNKNRSHHHHKYDVKNSIEIVIVSPWSSTFKNFKSRTDSNVWHEHVGSPW